MRAMLEPMRAKAFVGGVDEVADRLRALAARCGLDELVVNTWTHDAEVRRRSYTLLAQAFALAPEAKAPT